MKIFEKIKYDKNREIRIFNFPLVKYTSGTYNFKVLFFKTAQHQLFDRIMYNCKNSYDLVIVFRSATGDIVFLKSVIDALCKKYKSKNVLIVSRRKFYKELFELFNFDCDFMHIDFSFELSNCLYSEYYKNTNFYIFHNYNFLSSLYKKRYVKSITEEWCKSNKIEMCEIKNIPVFARSSENQVQKILNDNNLEINLSKFVFLAFDDGSLKAVSDEFVSNLINIIKSKGYDYFMNSKNKKYDPYKTALLNYKDTLDIASKAKLIISLRSGLSDILTNVNVKQILVYNNSKTSGLTAERVKDLWSFKGLSYAKNKEYREFEYSNGDEKQLLEKITKELK